MIIVAAAKFELEPIKNALEAKGFTPEVKILGVGSINTAKKCKAVAEACRGKHAVFVGSCGQFVGFKQVELVRVSSVHWLPTGDRMKFSYTVEKSAPPLTLTKVSDWASELPAKKAICCPSVSLVKTLPEGFDPATCVENLELYSCAQEIQAAALSFTALLAITNEVGENAHMQWKQNFGSAASKTADFICNRVSEIEK